MKGNRSSESSGSRRGLMLMECLVYLSIWFVLVSVGLGLFYQAYSKAKQLSRNAQDLIRTLEVGERWRAEVRASRVAPRWVSRAEGDGGQDFLLGDDSGWIAYRATGSNILRRTASQLDWREVLPRVQASTLLCDERGSVVSWRWELELRPFVQRARVCPRFSFQAVPGPAAGQGGEQP